MKAFFITSILFLVLGATAFSQQTTLLDEVPVVPCGDFLARMDNLLITFQNQPDITVYLVYYGGKYREKPVYKSSGEFDKTLLQYPHRTDGLNWAKTIDLYLRTAPRFPKDAKKRFEKQIVPIDGGYRKETAVQIWLGDRNAIINPEPTVNESDIEFRAEKPTSVYRYARCYEN